MPIRRGARTISTITGGDLAIDIDHTQDSVTIGDETNKMVLQDVGGVKSIPVKSLSSTTDAVLTGGTQKTQIVDGDGDVAQVDVIGAEKALKVSVISATSGLAFAEVDNSNFTASTTEFVPIGAQYDADGSADLADGKMGTLRATAERALHVHITSTDVGSSGGTSMVDDAAFTVGTSSVTPMGAMFDNTATDSVDEGDVGVPRMTADRVLLMRLEQVASVTVPVSAASLPLPSGASTLAEQQTQTTALQLIDDGIATIASATPTKGMVAIGHDGTNARALKTDASGELQVDVLSMPTVAVTGTFWQATQPVSGTVTANLAAGTNNIGDVDVLSLPALPAGTNNIGDVDVLTLPGVAGTAAHDAGVSGNPVRIGGRAMLANGTAVAEDDTVDVACDNQGRVLATLHVPRDLTVHGTATLTTTSETTLIAAGAAGVFHDITKLVLTNSSATATRVAVKDSTAGTTRIEVALAANGGAVIDFGAVPMCQATAANNWTVTLSGAVTSIYCYAQAIKRIA